MAKQFYSDIFKHSGPSYHRAMQLFPAAREQEFKHTSDLLEITKNSSVLDVPAGGGYLQAYLPAHVNYTSRDFSMGFVDSNTVSGCSETDLKVADQSIDNLVCLAALHHVKDQHGFLHAAYKALKQTGLLLIGDVIEGSAQDEFLNQFVDQWNSLGHQGDFINETLLSNKLIAAGFVANYTVRNFTWNFNSIIQARQYFRLLFNLDKNPADDVLDLAIHKLGALQNESSFEVNWALGFFQARKQSQSPL